MLNKTFFLKISLNAWLTDKNVMEIPQISNETEGERTKK
jgi:hypothetical protein